MSHPVLRPPDPAPFTPPPVDPVPPPPDDDPKFP